MLPVKDAIKKCRLPGAKESREECYRYRCIASRDDERFAAPGRGSDKGCLLPFLPLDEERARYRSIGNVPVTVTSFCYSSMSIPRALSISRGLSVMLEYF